jgi:hypothetical protein
VVRALVFLRSERPHSNLILSSEIQMPVRPMNINDIDFGIVERAITIGEQKMMRGFELSHEVLARMPTANRNALIENRFISVFPKGVTVRRQDGATMVAAPISSDGASAAGEMHVIAKGFGKWDVIQGTIIAAGLTSKAEAQAVAGIGQAPEAPVNQPAQASPASPPKRKRRASPGRRLPPKPPGAPQDNGPVEG